MRHPRSSALTFCDGSGDNQIMRNSFLTIWFTLTALLSPIGCCLCSALTCSASCAAVAHSDQSAGSACGCCGQTAPAQESETPVCPLNCPCEDECCIWSLPPAAWVAEDAAEQFRLPVAWCQTSLLVLVPRSGVSSSHSLWLGNTPGALANRQLLTHYCILRC